MEKIKIGIVGYGNLGKSAEVGISQNKDMELVGIFTRRNPSEIRTLTGAKAYHIDEAQTFKGKIHVMILCGGSATDLPEQTPLFAASFNTVDAFDTHAKIPEYFDKVDQIAQKSGTVCIISGGWDPGMFSINRLYNEAILPQGKTYTFWGPGISQGHSDAIRRISGVADAKQYTIPIEEAVNSVRSGTAGDLTPRERHKRVCYVVAKDGANKERIEHQIKTMPNYFEDYDTTVHFVTQEELNLRHAGLPHGGMVITRGKTGINCENSHTIEYKIALDSNPDFTANVLLALARAAFRLNREGVKGAKTVADIPPAYLSPKSPEEIRKLYI